MFDVNIIQRILLVEFDITLKENVFINICPQVSPAISAKKLVDHEPEETGKKHGEENGRPTRHFNHNTAVFLEVWR